MKTKIRQKITNLNAEAEQLISIRDSLSSQLAEVNTRITQIVGAVRELNELLKEGSNEEESTVTDSSENENTERCKED